MLAAPIIYPLKFKLFKFLISLVPLMFITGCQSKTAETEFVEGTPEFIGHKLFNDMACSACHTINGSLKLGPSLQNQYGKEILHTDGTVLIVNDKYIKESLIDPLRYIVEGYTPIMPSYAPILNGNDIENIIAYIKTLK